ncbi:MAG TPA: peptidase M48 family protein [Rhodospirillaceae bacterium]|nr:peptidase M48 family protein [Rhodospirillaceae bacterium]
MHLISMHGLKTFFKMGVFFLVLSGCTTNLATGEKQFTAFMPAEQEAKIGAENHQAILDEFGYYEGATIQAYVNNIGQKIAKHTERDDVKYTFTVVDSPVVNAFAVPGGYIYISRGLMALANDEALLASVIGHEIGHITARHSAQQQSQGVLANLGLAALSIATDAPAALGQAASLGADLYLKSYSRKHEHQADELGIRYLYRAGYNPSASAEFLEQLEAEGNLNALIEGKNANAVPEYFSTHPITTDRIDRTIQLAANYPLQSTDDKKVTYFSTIDGIVYGESPRNGYVRGQDFIHTELGFKFSFPEGYKISNLPTQVVGQSSNSVMVFDGAKKEAGQSIQDYLINVWLKNRSDYAVPETITVNGMPAVTTSFSALASGKTRTTRIIAIAFDNTQVYRFAIQTANPPPATILTDLKRATYSFKKLSAAEKAQYKPKRIKVFAAKAGDTVASLAARIPFDDHKEQRFRVLNGLSARDTIQPNKLYKTIVE